MGQGGPGLTGVASGEGLDAGMEREGGEREEDFWATGVVDGRYVGVSFVAVLGLGAGVKPGGGDKVEGLGGGMKPTTGGRNEALEVGLEDTGAEHSEVVLVWFTATTGDLTSCLTEPELTGLCLPSCGFGGGSSSFFSSFISTGSTAFSSFFSFFFSSSSFSGRSSLHILGRGSLVLPLTMRFVNPREMSSLSSILMTSCLKENPDIMGALDTGAGAGVGAGTAFTGSASDLATCGALSDGCVNIVVSSCSAGMTFLTTRRTTFTTFLRVRPLSSIASI